MLIAAVPRSASTSLATAVAEQLRVPFVHEREFYERGKTGFCWTCSGGDCEIAPDDWDPLADDGERRELRNFGHLKIARWIRDRTNLYRQHVAPTDHNLSFLESADRPFVVVVRDAENVVQSFRRRVDSDRSGVPYFFPRADTLSHNSHDVGLWRSVADDAGILDRFRRWRERWEERGADNDQCLLLSYRDVVQDSRAAVRAACRWVSGRDTVELPEGWELPRERYTRAEP